MGGLKVLFDVLNIIDYQDNKEEFVNEFVLIVLNEVFGEMLSRIPEADKEKIVNEFYAVDSEDEKREVLLKYFSLDEVEEKISKVTELQFLDYLETIYPTLSSNKQDELTGYLNNLPKLREVN